MGVHLGRQVDDPGDHRGAAAARPVERHGVGGFLGTVKTLLGWVAAAVFLGGIALLFWTILPYLNQEYVLTNRRVIQIQGVVNKRAADSSLEKINDAVLTQSVFGRIFDFGDLEDPDRGGGGDLRVPDDHRPDRVQEGDARRQARVRDRGRRRDARHRTAVAGRRALVRRRGPGRGPLPPAPGRRRHRQHAPDTAAPGTPGASHRHGRRTTSPARWHSLADLRDRGAITPEEYERKKAELLGRL